MSKHVAGHWVAGFRFVVSGYNWPWGVADGRVDLFYFFDCFEERIFLMIDWIDRFSCIFLWCAFFQHTTVWFFLQSWRNPFQAFDPTKFLNIFLLISLVTGSSHLRHRFTWSHLKLLCFIVWIFYYMNCVSGSRYLQRIVVFSLFLFIFSDWNQSLWVEGLMW